MRNIHKLGVRGLWYKLEYLQKKKKEMIIEES